MAETDHDQKTEQPSEKRLSDAAERGQFARTPELSVLFTVAAALGVLALTAQTAAHDVAEYAVSMFTRFGRMAVTRDMVTVQLGEVMLVTGRAVMPVLLGCVGAAVFAGGVQSGF